MSERLAVKEEAIAVIDWDDPDLVIGDGVNPEVLLSKQYEQLAAFSKAELIQLLPYIPSNHIGKTPAEYNERRISGIPRQDCFNDIEFQYESLSLWLRFMELGEEWLLPEILSPERGWIKIQADFSQAVLQFCSQIWLKSPEIQQNFPSFQFLWFLVENGSCYFKLRESGVFQAEEPDLIKGKLPTKRQKLSIRAKFISFCRSLLKNKDLNSARKFFRPYDDRDMERSLQYILGIGIIRAIGERDEDLEHHCKRLLRAAEHHQKMVSDPSYQIVRALADGSCYVTGDKKKSRGFGAKKPRGRPIKSKEL